MKTRITIRGRHYTVRNQDDGIDLREVAAYVDAHIARVGATAPSLQEFDVAMLAAMNIGEEFFRYRRQVDGELRGIERDLTGALVLLEAGLPPMDDDGVPDDLSDDADGDPA
jgi:cell division protein ZapA (FtsZ GTPase activity inhibitor)